ncbi:hypothetical protein RJ639_008813 [Escallonia herrerae]|uniref:Glycosyltransferase n=1 Tax=Escallonia herrerae TaxID=1293975 RepID=A0AA89AT93_9ASTE|nr:hypothetical protein RJ639_008813 [Escallonia herrerae]
MKYPKKETVILVPYPAQGHVTPMLKLASVMVTWGFRSVVVMPEFIHRQISTTSHQNEILCMSIPDGLEEGAHRDFGAIEMAMENNMPCHLEGVIRKLDEEEDGGVACLVVDLLASWAINVANQCGIQVAGFWPAMLATYRLIEAIPYMLQKGIISETGTPQHQGPICFEPEKPTLSTEDLPWLIGTLAMRNLRFMFWTRTLDRSRSLPWLIINTFPGEDCHVNLTSGCLNSPRVYEVGPLSSHATSKDTTSFWEEDMSCLDWLDIHDDGTVVYISFGSWVSPIGEGKVRSLALALEASGRPFIWVLGHTWREGLPVGYLERVGKQGKVVSWAPQLEVLQHEAVGCYLTHCGWNSTLEAIQCKKRLLCYPVAGDQFVNCYYIANVWQVGVRICGFGEKDVEQGIKSVMEDEEMNQRLEKLNERILGKEARLRVVDNFSAFIGGLRNMRMDSPTEDNQGPNV